MDDLNAESLRNLEGPVSDNRTEHVGNYCSQCSSDVSCLFLLWNKGRSGSLLFFRREQKKRTGPGEASAMEEGTHGAMGHGTLEPLLFP